MKLKSFFILAQHRHRFNICITFTTLFLQICLLDFGASRSYDKKFVDKYIKVRLFILPLGIHGYRFLSPQVN